VMADSSLTTRQHTSAAKRHISEHRCVLCVTTQY
jgi:hypothetical protein